MRPDIYIPSFRRALYKYANNGFFARYLDADDVAFIEGIRERGCIGCESFASLSATPYAVMEQQNYWRQGWAEEPGVERRAPPPRPSKPQEPRRTPESLRREANRLAITAAKAAAQAEWDEQEARRQSERERRIVANMLADMEWEMAGAEIALRKARDRARWAKREPKPKRQAPARPTPKRRPLMGEWKKPGERPDPFDNLRFYVPYWQRDEIRRMRSEARAERKARRPASVPKPPAPPPRPRPPPPQPKPPTPPLPPAAVAAIERMFAPSLTVEVLTPLPAEMSLKMKILTRVREGGARVWALGDLMQATGCFDPAAIIQAARELRDDGYIGRRVDAPR